MISYLWIVVLLGLFALSTALSLYLFLSAKSQATRFEKEQSEMMNRLTARLERLEGCSPSEPRRAAFATPPPLPASVPAEPAAAGRNAGEMRLVLKVAELRKRMRAGKAPE